MLRLKLSLAPEWVEVAGGVRLFCAPCTTSVLAEARGSAEVQAVVPAGNAALISHLVAKRVAHLVVRDWEGVGDVEGNPVPVEPDWIEALFEADHRISDRFLAQVVTPALEVDAEKNV